MTDPEPPEPIGAYTARMMRLGLWTIPAFWALCALIKSGWPNGGG